MGARGRCAGGHLTPKPTSVAHRTTNHGWIAHPVHVLRSAKALLPHRVYPADTMQAQLEEVRARAKEQWASHSFFSATSNVSARERYAPKPKTFINAHGSGSHLQCPLGVGS